MSFLKERHLIHKKKIILLTITVVDIRLNAGKFGSVLSTRFSFLFSQKQASSVTIVSRQPPPTEVESSSAL